MFKIRNATIEDAESLASAEREIAKIPGRLASRPHELSNELFKERIANLSKSENGKYIVIESGDKIIGHALLDPFKLEVTSHAADLTIAVHEGSQRIGASRALLSNLIEWARQNPKVEKIMLHVRSSNTAAIALYQKFGFVVEGVRVKQIKLGEGVYLDNIAMALWVGD